MRIPEETIDDVRQATDIVDVIGALVQLKKRGKNFLGLCPFHQEKTPSFNVSPDRQMFHCFGCGKGGNVFSFLIEYEKVTFVEAVRTLAERAGIHIPESGSGTEEQRKPEEDLHNVCRLAALHFYNNMVNTNEGKLGLEYFKSRGFTPETIRTFGLGYSMNGWETLIQHMKEQNIAPEMLEKAGLARRREDKSYYDYFRGRAMFPIFTRTGRVVGFGARKMLDSDTLAKYINSPETPVYNKSKILYGISQAKEAIREKEFAILVEGYADLISVYQAGFKNVVASSGTALTRDQIRLIKDYTKRIVIMYDADSAGSAATIRGVDLILEAGMEVRIVELPDGHDPDTYVKEAGPKAFQLLLDKASGFIDYIAAKYEREGKLATPEGQTETVRALVTLISKIDDEIKRNFYIRQIAQQYNLPEATLHRELQKIAGRQENVREYRQAPEIPESRLVPVVGKAMVDKPVEIPVAERDLIHAMIDGGVPLVMQILEYVDLSEFTHPFALAIAEHIVAVADSGRQIEPASLIDAMPDQRLRDIISDIVFARYQLSKRWTDDRGDVADPAVIARDAIVAIKRRQLEILMDENRKDLAAAASRGEDIMPFQRRQQELEAQRKQLMKRAEPVPPSQHDDDTDTHEAPETSGHDDHTPAW